MQKISQIYIVACGSAYHVGMAVQYVIEDFTSIPVRVELASEFRYRKMTLVKDSLVIIISQSGETADSLAALREAKDKGIKTLGIVNVYDELPGRQREVKAAIETEVNPMWKEKRGLEIQTVNINSATISDEGSMTE